MSHLIKFVKHTSILSLKRQSLISVLAQPAVNHSTDGKDGKNKDKAKKKDKTPRGRFDGEEFDTPQPSYNEKEPLEKYPMNIHPKTGEVGGPRGPEPTRYGDWERKGRISDF